MPCPEYELENYRMTLSCQAEWLSQQLDNGCELVILDCRSPDDYNASHIQGGIHVAIPTLMMRRRQKGNLSVCSVINSLESKEKFNKSWKTETLVVYDECTSDINANTTSVVSLLTRRLKEDGCRVCLLEGGFSSFQEKYPHHCAGLKEDDVQESAIIGLRNLQISDQECPEEEVPTPNSTQLFPVEVVPYLFLGNAKNSADLECLYKNGIKYILNVTPNVPNTFENTSTFKYLQIPITDHWSENLSAFFPKAIAFIDEARSQNSGVLVHCLAGISRSVTVVVAYLMHSLKLSLNDAYDYVKRCKPNISPNFNFMGQLLDFERTLHHTNSTSCECEKDKSSPDGTPCKCTNSPKYYFSSPSMSLTPLSDMSTTPTPS
jgi:dual specificity MAP kinase phosphatase